MVAVYNEVARDVVQIGEGVARLCWLSWLSS